MINLNLNGIYIPNITPFNSKGEIIFESLGVLLEFWIENGVSGIVANASTGEAPYLRRNERIKIIDYIIEKVNGRVQVFAGTGTPSLWQSIELTRDALNSGAQAALITTPFFYKPTGDEISRYFIEIMDAVDIPVILYNVPKFTGYSVSPKVVALVAEECSNLVAMKDSSNNPGNMADVINLCGNKINALSGAADMILPTLSIGGTGAIVAIGNVVPKICVNIVDAYRKSDIITAGMNQLMASKVNKVLVRKYPQIPAIKAAIQHVGFQECYPRKPLTKLTTEVVVNIMEELEI